MNHLAQAIPVLLKFVYDDKLRLPDVATHAVPLKATAISDTLDKLETGWWKLFQVIEVLV